MNGRHYKSWNDGSSYDGDWNNDNMEGRGLHVWSSGNSYDGEWLDGKMNGRGVYKYVDGAIYDGFWKDQKKEGRGFYKWYTGATYDGDWKDDKQVKTTTIKSNHVLLLLFTHPQSLTLSYLPLHLVVSQDGRGLFNYSDGSSYEGQFSNNMKHGYGTYTWASGQIVSGEWCKNEKVTSVSGEPIGLVPPHLTSDHQQTPPPPPPPPYLKSFIASQTRSTPTSSSPPSPTTSRSRSSHTSMMHPMGYGRISSTAAPTIPHHRTTIHHRLPLPPVVASFGRTVTPGLPMPIVYKNRAGFRMGHGHFDCSHKLYCGRSMGVDNIPGSNGVCGPNTGPQCSDCLGITTSNEHTFISTNGSAKKAHEWIISEGRDVVMEEEDDSDIREAIRRSLTECRPVPKVFVNRAGYRMCLGEHMFYCSRWMGVDHIPGSDGQCGPNNGPQCADCLGAVVNDSHRYLSLDGTAKSAEYWIADEGEDNDLVLMEAIRRSQLDMQGENMVVSTGDDDGQENSTNIVSSSNSSTNNSSDNMADMDMAYGTPPKPPPPIPPQFINTTTDPSTPMGNASSMRPPTWFAVSPVQTQAPSSFTPVYRLAPSPPQQQQHNPLPIPIRIPTEDSAVCVICMVQPRTMAFAPCGHLCICTTCCDDLKKAKRLQHCVMCQTKATTCLRIFN